MSGTGCATQDLAIFNYDRKARTWLAACQARVFVCSKAGNSAKCVQQAPESIDPALSERIEVLAQVPAPQRDLFVNYDMGSQDWDGFAKTAAIVARLRPNQAREIANPLQVYTDFSAEFDSALIQCIGPDAVARVDVSTTGGLTVSPNRPCLTALRSHPEMGALRARAGNSFYLAAGVRAVEPMQRPGAEEPEPEPEISPLELAVRDWLDESATDVLACTNSDRAVISVQVDPEGNARISLREELAETAAEGCVRSALTERVFEGGPGEIVHLLRAPEPEPEAEEPSGPAAPATQGKGQKAPQSKPQPKSL